MPNDLDVGTIRKVKSGFYNVLAVNTDRRVFVRAGLGDKRNPGGSSWRLLIDEAVDLAECECFIFFLFSVFYFLGYLIFLPLILTEGKSII